MKELKQIFEFICFTQAMNFLNGKDWKYPDSLEQSLERIVKIKPRIQNNPTMNTIVPISYKGFSFW